MASGRSGGRSRSSSRSFGRRSGCRSSFGHYRSRSCINADGNVVTVSTGGNFFALFMAGVLFTVFGVFAIISLLIPFISHITTGGYLSYDDGKIQEYTDEKYYKLYGETNCVEDNILIVFLVDTEEYFDYYYCAWMGSHLDLAIRDVFNGDGSYFDSELMLQIDDNYKDTLDENLTVVMRNCVSEVVYRILRANPTNSFSEKCTCGARDSISSLYNYSSIEIETASIQRQLYLFENGSDIAISLIIEDADVVFDREIEWSLLVGAVMSFISFVVGACMIFFAVKHYMKKFKDLKNRENNGNKRGNYNSSNSYADNYQDVSRPIIKNEEFVSKPENDNDEFDIDEEKFEIDSNDY